MTRLSIARNILLMVSLALLLAACTSPSAPSIDSFSADPTSGEAPLETTFSWSVSQTGNGAITCTLAFGDGTDTEIADCLATTSVTHTYNAAGTYDATLTASNAQGEDMETVTVRVEAETFSETEVAEALGRLLMDLEPLLMGLEQNQGLLALLQYPRAETCPRLENLFTLITFTGTTMNPAQTAGALETLAADNTLARGTYTFDPATGDCTFEDNINTLIVRYPYDKDLDDSDFSLSGNAEIAIDWGEPTLEVAGRTGETFEVPTDMSFALTTNGNSAANFDIVVDWYNTATCGTEDGILEPVNLRVNGNFGFLTFTDVGYTIVEDASEDSITVGGTIGSPIGLELTVRAAVFGELTRQDCFIDTFKIDRGNVEVSLDAPSNNFDLAVSVSNIIIKPESEFGFVSATLADGSFDIDGNLAVSFAGTLDDENDNAVFGDNVTLTFSAGGSTTLENFLIGTDVSNTARIK